jgi:hypothetical protein
MILYIRPAGWFSRRRRHNNNSTNKLIRPGHSQAEKEPIFAPHRIGKVREEEYRLVCSQTGAGKRESLFIPQLCRIGRVAICRGSIKHVEKHVEKMRAL